MDQKHKGAQGLGRGNDRKDCGVQIPKLENSFVYTRRKRWSPSQIASQTSLIPIPKPNSSRKKIEIIPLYRERSLNPKQNIRKSKSVLS